MKVRIKPCKIWMFPLTLISEEIKNGGFEVRIRNEREFESAIFPHYIMLKSYVYEVKE